MNDRLICFFLSTVLLVSSGAARAQTAFTYQGQLKDNATPVSGAYDLLFTLHDDSIAGSQIGATASKPAVNISNGVFSTQLDFGGFAFEGSPRWLEIRVRPSGGTGNYTTLAPRQAVAPTPYSLYSRSAGNVPDGVVTNQKIAPNAVTTDRIQDSAVTGSKIGTGQVVRSINSLKDNVSLSAGPNVTITTNGNSIQISANGGSSGAWNLNGNSGTIPGTSFFGTTDRQPLEFKVNNSRVLRIEPEATNTFDASSNITQAGNNIVAGYRLNRAENGAIGVTIGGGGGMIKVGDALAVYGNTVSGNFGTVSGGVLNGAGSGSFVGGGYGNSASNLFVTVGGGNFNEANGYSATIGGGTDNKGTGSNSTISGGSSNKANGSGSVIGGGSSNLAGGSGATVGGGQENSATNGFSTVSGGSKNVARGVGAFVGGGESNIAIGDYAAIGGGSSNTATNTYSTVGGGKSNRASGDNSTISGGESNIASGFYTSIGGGRSNVASIFYATVAGGLANTNMGDFATIGGGNANVVTGGLATVSGGLHNIAGGNATVCGGADNTASGILSTVAGGGSNVASGRQSFAAGYFARAVHNGAFVWGGGDTNPNGATSAISSTAENQFTVRCLGGARFISAVSSVTPTAGVQLAPGGGSWSTLSDRASKTNFATVAARDVLERLAAIPIQTWNYKSQEASVRHIGPVAQDFAAAFGLGEDDTHINTVDADGIALAAIQGLHQLVKEKDAQIKELNERVARLEKLIVSRAEQRSGGEK